MSRKDYELIAEAIRQAKELITSASMNEDDLKASLAGIHQAQHSISLRLEAENDRFDPYKFHNACEWVKPS